MKIHIISLFPESIRWYLNSSILQKAQEKGLFEYTLYNLADWTVKNTRRVDDRPYGGGSWTIITIEPLYNCITEILQKNSDMPIFYMSPRWEVITQKFLQKTTKESEILIICGHYEGIDERIFSLFPIVEVSIWEYVLSSGELASMVFVDGVVRLIDGVLSKESLEEESFSEKLHWKKEYPQYSRPQEFLWLSVPLELISWDHKKIEQWKKNSLR